MDLVSVIVPVYNASLYLNECIDSIINNTYKNIELILINDGSKDNSLDIINSYKDERIKVINTLNKGVVNARKVGISFSKGKYIMFVDADDYIDSKMIEILVNKIGDSDMIRCNQITVNGKKLVKDHTIKQDGVVPTDEVYKLLYTSIYMNSIWKSLMKREIAKDIEIKDINYGEDLLFNFELINKCNKISFAKDNLYYYRINKLGVTLNKDYDILMKKLSSEIYAYTYLYNHISNDDYKLLASNKLLFYITRTIYDMNLNKKKLIKLMKQIEIVNLVKQSDLGDYKLIYKLGMNAIKEKKYTKLYHCSKLYNFL